MSKKKPAIQFYVGDWMKEPTVRSVSLEARGLWIDMLCLMHESSRRGYLQQPNGTAIGPEQLARMVGCTVRNCVKLLQELENAGTFSREDNSGTIYSRRMLKDERKRLSAREFGKRGGNPILKRRVKPPDKPPDGSSSSAKPKGNITPSASEPASGVSAASPAAASYGAAGLPPEPSDGAKALWREALDKLRASTIQADSFTRWIRPLQLAGWEAEKVSLYGDNDHQLRMVKEWFTKDILGALQSVDPSVQKVEYLERAPVRPGVRKGEAVRGDSKP